MPQFYIHAVDGEYDSRDDGADYDDPDQALTAGVRSALRIAADEIGDGRMATAVEISIEREDGSAVCRSVLALSVSPLLIGEL